MLKQMRHYWRLWNASGDLFTVGVPMCSDISYLGGWSEYPYIMGEQTKLWPFFMIPNFRPVTFHLYGHMPLAPFLAEEFSPQSSLVDILLRNLNVIDNYQLNRRLEGEIFPHLLHGVRDGNDLTMVRVATGSAANIMAVLIGLGYAASSRAYSDHTYKKYKVAISNAAHAELENQLNPLLGERLLVFDTTDELVALMDKEEMLKVVVLSVPTTSANTIEVNQEILELSAKKSIWIHLDCALGVMEMMLPTKRAKLIMEYLSSKLAKSWSINLHKLVDIEPAALIFINREYDSRMIQSYFIKHTISRCHGLRSFGGIHGIGSTSISHVPYSRAMHKINQLGSAGLRYYHLHAHMTAVKLGSELRRHGLELLSDPSISAVSVKLDIRTDPEEFVKKFDMSFSAVKIPQPLLSSGMRFAIIKKEGSKPPGIRIVIPIGVLFSSRTINLLGIEIVRVFKPVQREEWERLKKPEMILVPREYLRCIEAHFKDQYLDTDELIYEAQEVIRKLPRNKWRIPGFVKARARLFGWNIRKVTPRELFPL
jgi:glutamate/tyrosine decarboxylase-like PLP-dependent enzyme